MIGLLVFVFMLAGCGNGDSANSSGNSGDWDVYNFLGSSDNWHVSYEADISNGDMETNTGTIEYTGEEQAPETIDYKIDYNSGNTEGSRDLLNGEVDLGRSSCGGCAVIQEDEEIEVEITWDGQTENLILTTDE
jgi:hypothetical protein